MIRFACPGCNATYTVEDTKGGKAGKCPKCEAQFVIPAAEAMVVSPPPAPAPRRLPPPPPTPAADAAAVEIKPCPKCGARLSVAAADIGVVVACPYCQEEYTAQRAGAAGPAEDRPSRRRDEPRAEDQPSRRSRRDDDDDDRPRRRPTAEADDDEDRPRRRRDEDDDEDDRPRRKKKRRGRSSEVDMVARLNYILGGLAMLCGCGLAGLGGLAGAVLGAAGKQPGAKMPVDPATATTILLVLGVVQILFGVVLIVAGTGVSKRQHWGRVMTFGTAGLGILFGLLYLVNIVVSLIGGNIPGAVGGLVGGGIMGGYGITAMKTMLAHGDEFE